MSEITRTLKSGVANALGAAPPRTREFAARTGAWLERTCRPDRSIPSAPPEAPPATSARDRFPTERPLRLPAGLSEEALRALYATWSIDGEPAGHMDAYVGDSFARFVHTYSLASGLTGVALELGANPYFTTYLLDEHSDLEMVLANYFDGSTERVQQRVDYIEVDGTPVTKQYESLQFNIEDERFPFDDGSLDAVLFCEIIEHLLMNPVAVLREISRILRPGGSLVLTTPNVCRLPNMVHLIEGHSIYDPYSGYGPYGRHNREYTMAELVSLLEFVGFDVVESFTADGNHAEPLSEAHVAAIADLLGGREHELGQYLCVRAERVRDSREGLPDNLFRSWPAGEIVPAGRPD